MIIAPILEEPCVSDDPATVKTIQDLASFSIRQEATIKTCELKRSELVKLIKGAKP